MNKVKNILSINCSTSSGAGKGMMEVAEIARENGYQYYTISPYTAKNRNFHNHFHITKRWQKFLNRNISKVLGDDNFLPFAETNKLIKIIKKIKPDLIHLRGLHGYYVKYISLVKYLNKKNIPVVWTQHDCWAFTGLCYYFEDLKCNRWMNNCGECPLLKSKTIPRKSLFFDRTRMMIKRKRKIFTKLENCHIISVSKWLEEKLYKSLFNAYNISTIENGVDTKIFKPTPSTILEDYNFINKKIILGVASSWSKRKGLDDFFQLKEKIKDSNIEFVIIGASDDIIPLCEKNGINALKRTRSKEELAKWYSACDVFFNPSTEETFGRVTAEAMACGAPIVAYNSTATPELLSETNNHCVESKNIEQVEDSIRDILKTNKSHYTMLNISKAREKYDMRKQFIKYIDLYNKILEK